MTPCFDAWNTVYSPISIYPQNFRPPNLIVWPIWHFLVIFGGFLGSNGHFFMYNTHFQCFHQKQNVVPHLYASFGYLQIIHLGARAKKHQFWAVLMYQLFFFMYDTLFWCLKQSLQPNIYLSTKFQTSKFNGLAVMAFFSDFWFFFGAKWPFFHIQQPFLMPPSEAECRAPSLHYLATSRLYI